jgi:multisubunit Na+/H+ antiporter MnhC subunit
MPITTLLVLSAIVAAFALFAVVLAWGEMQTRHSDLGRRRGKSTAATVRGIQAKAQATSAGSAKRQPEVAAD